ncbi:hypothetical protein [Tepidimicrobium xylanilyticum]|uniref:hypothetical protein n=1 Tax=Tepidimicrobium xylanilyticum TaxID=1123352 RepID=UPI00264EFC62|nr:hypothetical protein [Tepidimicrobium xylanilyticum]GMG97596.1 hypothetical protein EN5CB1_24220 [Tepidimicrobium xylanilyticum]
MKDKRSLKIQAEEKEKEAKNIKNTKTKEQEEIEMLMNIIICENKETLNELAK